MSVLRRHRQWCVLIAAAAALLIAAGAISLTVVANVSRGPAFQSAATFLRSGNGAEVVRQQLGAVLGFGTAVTGPISESGNSGSANLSFSVHGNWRDGHVRLTEWYGVDPPPRHGHRRGLARAFQDRPDPHGHTGA